MQRSAGRLWCPNQLQRNGKLQAPLSHWSLIEEINDGNFIVACNNQKIRALLVSKGNVSANIPVPVALKQYASKGWGPNGWELQVDFLEFQRPPSRQEIVKGLFKKEAPDSPFKTLMPDGSGDGLQVFLGRIPDWDGEELFDRLLQLLSSQQLAQTNSAAAEDGATHPATTYNALQSKRIGQDTFRKRVIDLLGPRCCATGLDRTELLRASHIYPWAISDNYQRLDGHNGLLLSAAFDAAFDKHLITLDDNGAWINVAQLSPAQLLQAGLDRMSECRVEGLDSKHKKYLELHRQHAKAKFGTTTQ